jgi:hypothetical protein
MRCSFSWLRARISLPWWEIKRFMKNAANNSGSDLSMECARIFRTRNSATQSSKRSRKLAKCSLRIFQRDRPAGMNCRTRLSKRNWKGSRNRGRPSVFKPKSVRTAVSLHEENARLQNSICGVDFPFRSEFLKLRRWSLGFRRLTGNRTRQGEPGEEEFSDSEIE